MPHFGYKDNQTLGDKAKVPITGVRPDGRSQGIMVDENGVLLTSPINSPNYVSALGTPTVLTAAIATSRAALPAGVSSGDVIRVVANGADPVAFKFGDNTVTAATTDNLLLGRIEYRLKVPAGATHLAVIRTGASDVPVYVSEIQ